MGLLLPSQQLRRGWCQGHLAKEAGGDFCWPLSEKAVRWSLMGAAMVVLAETAAEHKTRAQEAGGEVSLGHYKTPAFCDFMNKCQVLLKGELPEHWQDRVERTPLEVVGIAETAEQLMEKRD